MIPFLNRRHAGRLLATALSDLAGRDDVVVLGLPRGGIPVAFEVASRLGAPLDAFAVRKIGAPGNEEFAVGALASGGIELIDWPLLRAAGIDFEDVRTTIALERMELERRERAYRDSRPAPELAGRTVVLVDDGLATGSTMLAAVRALRQRQPAHVIVAVPVASVGACDLLQAEGVEFRRLAAPEPFLAVGVWYRDFSQTTDDEVRSLLGAAAGRPDTSVAAG
jgi:predicted phosphoribosyltransferase